jgi:hypothetical protein
VREGVPPQPPFVLPHIFERRNAMPIYHCSVKNISRGSGKSSVASASYRSGEQLEDERQGLTFHYKKSEVAYSEIFLCKNAPQEYRDRGTLWNAVEQAEKQNNARLAREWEVALPNELSLDQCKELVNEFAQSLADEGMCVDVNIHWKDGNHHAHIMGTTRPIKENGEWGAKEKKNYVLDENGERIPILNEDGTQKLDSRNRKQWKRELVDSTGWNREEKVTEWRNKWETMTNKALEKANIKERVSAKSYEEQGIEKIPTIHEGYVARKMEQNGKTAERCEINREILFANMELNSLEHQQSIFIRLLEQLKEQVRVAQEAIRKAREEALNERFRQFRTARTVDEPAGRNADGNRPLQADHTEPSRADSRNAEQSIQDRLAALRSARGSGEAEQGKQEVKVGVDEFGTTQQEAGIGETISELLASARAGIDSATAKEENSGASRADREAERERLSAEAERRAREEEQRAREAREASKARSRNKDRGR